MKPNAAKPIVMETTVVEPAVVTPPVVTQSNREPADALDLVELASNADVPAEVESGSEPETFQTRGLAIPATTSGDLLLGRDVQLSRQRSLW